MEGLGVCPLPSCEQVHTLSPNVGPTEVCTAMCGNSDGSLTVAHGSRITAYDWSLARFSTLFSELPQVCRTWNRGKGTSQPHV